MKNIVKENKECFIVTCPKCGKIDIVPIIKVAAALSNKGLSLRNSTELTINDFITMLILTGWGMCNEKAEIVCIECSGYKNQKEHKEVSMLDKSQFYKIWQIIGQTDDREEAMQLAEDYGLVEKTDSSPDVFQDLTVPEDLHTVKDFKLNKKVDETIRKLHDNLIEKMRNALIESVKSVDGVLQCPECGSLISVGNSHNFWVEIFKQGWQFKHNAKNDTMHLVCGQCMNKVPDII